MRGGVFLLCLLFSFPAHGRHKMPERAYQEKYCPGSLEVKLADRTRVDCLTDEYAIEFDFAPKWAEAIGQSLHYAYMTGRHPAIYIIMESRHDKRYIASLAPLCDVLKIKLEIIKNY